MLSRLIQKGFWLDTWNIGVAEATVEQVIERGRLPAIDWWPEGPASCFVGDPFFHGDRILYEHLNRFRGTGDILSAAPDGSDARLVRRSGGHQSYPFSHKVDDRDLLLIETSDSGACVVNEWVDGALREVSRIAEPVVDPTLLKRDGIYWLFGTLAGATACSELHAWWSKQLAGPWQRLSQAPLKVDPVSARPAGAFIESPLGLLRPSQDCSETYGGAVVISRVDQLDLDGFAETPLVRIPPPAEYPGGFHTLNQNGNRIVVDAKRRVFHPLAWLFKLRNLALGISSN